MRALSTCWRAARWLTGRLAALVAVALTLGLAALAALPALGVRAMVVTSGSMVPTIGVGDLVLVQEVAADDVGVGDVVTYRAHGSEGMTTHRVLQRIDVQGRPHFQTKGDANDTPDPNLADAQAVYGRAVASVPHAGRALARLHGRWTPLLVLGPPSVLMVRSQLRALRAALGPASSPGRRRRPAVLLLAVAALGVLPRVGTGAAFVDAEPVGDNTFSTVPATAWP